MKIRWLIYLLDLNPRYLNMVKAVLMANAPDAEVWAYGGRVSGNFHNGSDLDLVLRNPNNPDQSFRNEGYGWAVKIGYL